MANNSTLDKLKLFSDIKDKCSILFAGEAFDFAANADILALPWSCVVTSAREVSMPDGFAFTRNITFVDTKDSIGRSLSQRNLKVVRLFGSKSEKGDDDEFIIMRDASDMFAKLNEISGKASSLFIAGYTPMDRFDSSMFFMELTRRQKETIFFFNGCESAADSTFTTKIGRYANIISGSIADFFADQLNDSDADFNLPNLSEVDISDSELVYTNSKALRVEKSLLNDLGSFATILTVEKLNEVVIAPYQYDEYFRSFLRGSAEKPQWYAYKHGFNLQREFENELYDKTKKSLEQKETERSQKDKEHKPIMLCGQTCSGKSVALGNLAFRIFCERRHAVIYINRSDVDFSSEGKNSTSEALKCLNKVLDKIKLTSSEPTLIIWDLKAVSGRDTDKCISLLKTLEGYGHHVRMVFTAYENMKSNQGNKFYTVLSTTHVEEEEMKCFRKILSEKTNLGDEAVDTVMRYMNTGQGNSETQMNIMATLYYPLNEFGMADNIRKGVYNEADVCLKELERVINNKGGSFPLNAITVALKNAGFEFTEESVSEDAGGERTDFALRLIKAVAISTFHACYLPQSLAFRLLSKDGSYDMSRIERIMSLPFFDYERGNNEPEYGEYKFKIRTKMEADILLDMFNLKADRRAATEILTELIGNVNDVSDYRNDPEIQSISLLIQRMGPNSNHSYSDNKASEFWETVIHALEEFRENGTGDNGSFRLQEIVYRRELTYKLFDEGKITKDDAIKRYEDAIRIGMEGKRHSEITEPGNKNFRDKLTIEISNSQLRLFPLRPNENLKLCEEVRAEMKRIIGRTPKDGYPYSTWLWAGINEIESEYKNPPDDETAKLRNANIIAEAEDMLDFLQNEQPHIYENESVYNTANRLLEHDTSDEEANKYFDALIKAGSPAGIMRRVRKTLKSNGVDIYKTALNISKEDVRRHVEICRSVCKDLLEKEEYSQITLQSPACIRLLLRLKWFVLTDKPLFDGEEQCVKISGSGWNELFRISEHYYRQFYNSGVAGYSESAAVLYVLALCYAQMDEFKDCENIINIIRNESEGWSGEGRRTSVRHMICDENGVPKTYDGTVLNRDSQKNYVWYIDIKKRVIPSRRGVYAEESNLMGINPSAGMYRKDFQLGIGFMGLGTYCGFKAQTQEHIDKGGLGR